MKMQVPAILGLAYCCSEIALSITRRSRERGESRDANSLRTLWIVIVISLWLGVQARVLFRQALLPEWAVPAGVVIFLIGIILRWWSIIHLGRFFTVNVSIAADHELVETGPYRFIRHPSYTGALLAFVGFGMAGRNWASLIITTLPITAAFLHRIMVEERALTEALGNRYREYMERTKRLVPFAY